MSRRSRAIELARRPVRSELLEEAAHASRAGLRTRHERMLEAARPILQTAVAASAAWLLATEVLGHDRPFFAPIAAVITLGLTVGERRRRAVELGAGVAVGIAIADLIVAGIGTGWWQIGVVVALAMFAAILVGGGPLLASQAGASAVLVATLQPPDSGFDFTRAVDGLAGAGVGLAVGSLLLPVNPARMVRSDAGPVIDGLAELSEMARHLRLAIGDARSLARGVGRAIAIADATPPEVATAMRELADATRALHRALDEDEPIESRERAVDAAATANAVLALTGNLSALHIVGQIRLLAVDLLRASGLERDTAQEAVRA